MTATEGDTHNAVGRGGGDEGCERCLFHFGAEFGRFGFHSVDRDCRKDGRNTQAREADRRVAAPVGVEEWKLRWRENGD